MEERYKRKLRKREEKKEDRRQAVAFRKRILIAGLAEFVVIAALAVTLNVVKKQSEPASSSESQTEKTAGSSSTAGNHTAETGTKEKGTQTEEPQEISFTISAAGDCTLGTDAYFDYASGFTGKYDEVQDPSYFLQNVKPVFEADDLTIVNLEGTLTEEETRAEKQFAFKAPPEYAKILTEGDVEAVNLANNHSKDYGEKSYTDTIDAVDGEGITSFGYDRTAVVDVKGVKVGLLGTYELAEHMGCEEQMIQNIKSLKEQGAQVIIASFHWGIERQNIPDSTQVSLAHSAIDNGADLVLGHHPHVLQGIEEYKGKNIVYSLGNFCFGGNKGPADMDTMIFQQTFTWKEGKLQEDNVTSIIPCKISSSWESGVNNYQPTPAEGEVKDSIMARIEEYSQAVAGN